MAPLCSELCLRNPQRWPLITRPSTPPTRQHLCTSTPTLPPSLHISHRLVPPFLQSPSRLLVSPSFCPVFPTSSYLFLSISLFFLPYSLSFALPQLHHPPSTWMLSTRYSMLHVVVLYPQCVFEVLSTVGWVRRPAIQAEFTSSLIWRILGLKTINRCFDSLRLRAAASRSFTL